MAHKLKHSSLRLAAAVACLAAAGLACGTGNGNGNGNGGTPGGSTPVVNTNPGATVAALSTSVADTATAEVVGQQATRVAGTATRESGINQTAIAAAATTAAQQAQDIGAQAATATAAAPILSELPKYGVDASQGEIAWVHPPANLDVEGFEQYAYVNQFISTVAGDFVVSTDITWNTRFGTSGCGLVLRTDGNEEALDQYLVIATRGANGHVFFAPMIDGEVVEDRIEDMYARGIDPLFSSANDTTNRLTVVGRGTQFDVYTNGTLVGQVSDDLYQRGFIALVALNQSGRTVCQFDNTWLWLFSN